MHVRWFGHGGARCSPFPRRWATTTSGPTATCLTCCASRSRTGWIQLWCLDHNHDLSWYDKDVHPGRARLAAPQYDRYIRDELLPFTQHVNANPFVIATGASFGAFHAMSIGLRNPQLVHRIIGMSGTYDITGMTGGYSDAERLRLQSVRLHAE